MNNGKHIWRVGADRWLALFAAATWGFTMWSRTAFTYYTSEMGISASQLGLVNFVTSIGSMIGAVVLCRLADSRKWHVQVLACGLFLSGLMQIVIAASDSFVLIAAGRFVMGFGLGCAYSLTQAIVKMGSSPQRYSANAGIVENGEAVISTMLGPVLIVRLISVTGWRRANLILMLPVVTLAACWLVLKRTGRAQGGAPDGADVKEKVTFRAILGVHNMRLCVLLGVLTLTNVWTMYTYCPLYWTRAAGLTEFGMSNVMTLAGVIAIGWCFLLPLASDRFGRKRIAAVFAVLCTVTYLLLALLPGSVLTLCFFVIFAGSACTLSMFFMALIVTESVRPEYAASSISLVNASSELFGGAVGPLIAGWLADLFSVRASMLFGAGCMALVAVLVCFLEETAPAFRKNQ